MAAVGPHLIFLLNKLQVSLMDQSRGLEGVARELVPHLSVSDPPKLLHHDWK